jgi:hypothetical protein
VEIAQRCGDSCDDYKLLTKAIVAYVTGEKNSDW